MLFNFKRLLKFIPVVMLVFGVLLFFAYREKIAERVYSSIPGLGFLQSIFSPDEEDVVEIVSGNRSLRIEIEKAETAEEIQRGLMYRESLCENCGMLFYFQDDQSGGFWMKNCLIPLDVVFIDAEGEIVDIKEDFEPCEEDPCPSYRPEKKYRYVLELNGGWVDDNDISVGDSISGV